VAHLYRAVLFDAGSLHGRDAFGSGSLWSPCSAGAIRSAQELLGRDKLVAVVSGTALRSKALGAAARSGGLPAGVASWSSGELICRTLEGRTPGSDLLQPLLSLKKPPKVFELGSLVKPRRWSDVAKRGDPPLESLANAGYVRRVDDVEKADVCYWDAQEGDELGQWLEAAVELCADLK
ncbi:unnamed protein product, partial [Polarella glacialis]